MSLNKRAYADYFSTLVSKIFAGLFLIVTILLIAQGQLTSIAFLTAGPALLGTVSDQSIELYNNILNSQTIKATLNKWKEILPQEENQKITPLNDFSSLKIENLTSELIRKSSREPLNLTIKKGQKIAFVGANGSGKSMFLKMLLGLENNFQGKIYFNDELLSREERAEINDQVNFLETKSQIFIDSINSNVALSSDVLENDVFDAKKRGLIDFQDQENYDLSKFSTGQKQRISLARSFFFDKDFVIWDEALSNLDPKRVKIFENMMLQKQDLTFIHILHTQNSASLAKYDQVVNF